MPIISRKTKKQIKYTLATQVLKVFVAGLERTIKKSTYGQEIVDEFIQNKQVCIPCFWHRQIIMSALFMLDWQQLGLNIGFLISPSGDGSLAAKIFVKNGAKLISGSSGRSGAQTMRRLYMAVKRDGISPVATPDGPRGPVFDFKPGPLLLASMTGAPILPIASASSNYWQLNSWDKFIMPKWFSTLNLVVGEPVYIDKGLPVKHLRPKCALLRERLMQISDQAENLAQKSNK